MNNIIRVTVLVENSVQRAGLKAEHGWSCLIEIGGQRVLFDTGQTELLLDNARVLGCSLENLDAIVLSHGHYDHTGGLAEVTRLSPKATVFAHPAAMDAKFTRDPDGSVRKIGMPESSKRALSTMGVTQTAACQEVVPGVYVTGQIPWRTDFEDVGGRFFLDERGQQPDPLVDDQAVFFETAVGIVVILGCAHAGVVNTLMHIGHLTDGKAVRAIIGGMHLGSANAHRLEQTVAYLKQANPSCVAPAHCTGMAATTELWTNLPKKCGVAAVGTVLTFGR